MVNLENIYDIQSTMWRYCETKGSEKCMDCTCPQWLCSLSELTDDTLTEQLTDLAVWDSANPPKCRQTEMLKLFPHIKQDNNGIIDICPQDVDPSFKCKGPAIDCGKCKKTFWFEEIKD